MLLPTFQLHFQQKPITIGLIYKQAHWIRNLAREKNDGKFPNSRSNTRKSSTHLSHSFSWLTPETLDWFNQRSHFVQ